VSGPGTYTHWGTDPDDGSKEPNNLDAPELCGAANSSQVYDNPEAWGWSDARCSKKLPFICKAIRKQWPVPLVRQPGVPHAWLQCARQWAASYSRPVPTSRLPAPT
jgi:hypothetical protein